METSHCTCVHTSKDSLSHCIPASTNHNSACVEYARRGFTRFFLGGGGWNNDERYPRDEC